MWSITFTRLRRVLVVLVLAVLVLAGCKGKETSTVSGTVKYKGKALTSGEIQFFNPDKGIASPGPIDSSGNYTLAGKIEPGTYKVYVQAPPPEQLPPGKVSPKPPFDLPPKYQDQRQTPVSKEVKAGPNTINIEFE